MDLKTGYTAQELATLKLVSLPQSRVGVMKKAKKELWTTQKRVGKGGGVEYSFDGLPANVQSEIKAKQYKSMMKAKVVTSNSLTPSNSPLSGGGLKAENAVARVDTLSDWQRKVAYSRIMLLNLLDDYVTELGKKELAYQQLSELSKIGQLPVIGDTDYNAVAEDCVVKQAKGYSGIGVTIVKRWYIARNKCSSRDEILAVLAPKKQGRVMIEPESCEWLVDFLAIYCTPQGYCLAEAYRKFVDELIYKNPNAVVPSNKAVSRVFNRLPKWVRYHKRLSGSAKRALFGFVRRDWNADFMRVNDIWVGDGHSLKVRVKHPMHGQPFYPELTLIMDASSRFIVGWSLSFSESGNAVGEALCFGFVHHGLCVIYYSDNGGGQKNKMFDTEVVGFFARLGIEHATGIPGNPQGRGIIERQMKEVPKRVAKSFMTYSGKDGDPEFQRKMLSTTDAYKRAVVKGKADEEMTDKERRGGEMLPTWDELVEEVKKQIHDYNYKRTHRSIGNRTPAQMREYLLTKYADDTDIEMLSPQEVRDAFRPNFERTVERAQVRFDNKYYRHDVLEDYEGVRVKVLVDVHDPSSVIVRDMEGVYLCEATLNGVPAFAKSYLDNAKAKSKKARLRLAQEKKDAIEAEDRKTIGHESSGSLSDLLPEMNSCIEGEFVDVTDKADDEFDGLDLYGLPDAFKKAG